jgi:hypothetical protein
MLSVDDLVAIGALPNNKRLRKAADAANFVHVLGCHAAEG